jgi:hypothetical protein
MFFRFRWSYEPIPEYELIEYKHGNYTHPQLIPGTFLPVENMENDYKVDRVAQKNYSFTGIKNFPLQDIAMMEDQWGPIADRTQEHLLTSDEGIIRVRQRLLRTARKLMEGQEPTEPWSPNAYKVRTVRQFFPSDLPTAQAVAEVKSQRMTARRPMIEMEAGG